MKCIIVRDDITKKMFDTDGYTDDGWIWNENRQEAFIEYPKDPGMMIGDSVLTEVHSDLYEVEDKIFNLVKGRVEYYVL